MTAEILFKPVNLTNSDKSFCSLLLVPQSVRLFLNPYLQKMDASWTIDGKYEKFEVTIKTDAYNYMRSYYTTALNYTFNELNAGVYYTVSVVTFNGDLSSRPTNISDYTSE